MLSEDEASELARSLSEDVTESYLDLKRNDSQRYRRAFVRSLFAMVEGQTYILKKRALQMEEIKPGLFSVAEIALLKEESYHLDKGKIQTRQQFVRPDDNILLALRLSRKESDPEYTTETDSSGWQAFREAIKIRNRITHPKDHSSLEITDDELQKTHEAFEWFFRSIIQVTLDHVAAVEKRCQDQVDKIVGISSTETGQTPSSS